MAPSTSLPLAEEDLNSYIKKEMPIPLTNKEKFHITKARKAIKALDLMPFPPR